MVGPESLPLLILLILLVGAFAGIMAGLLGVGGGIIIVPALFLVLESFGFDSAITMHIAVGTSLATIILTSIRSVRKHQAKGAVDDSILRSWAPGLFLGAVVGILIADQVSSSVLAIVFAVIALLVSVNMAISGDDYLGDHHLPGGLGGGALSGLIGTLSTLMGIGGGTLGVPTLSYFGIPIHRAVATSAGFGVVIAVPATIGFIWSGWGLEGLPPWSLGFVNLPAFTLIVGATMVFVPLGVRLAHWLKPLWLRRAFALFLALTAIRMIWQIVG